jgi:flagellar basal-body rod modification protein FlgD
VGATAPAASAADSGAGANGSTITSGDFLTLLVTEMQNQDPTAQTDPNEYINQLVGINSLEQLISMNQSLAAVLGAATTTTPSAPVPGVAGTAEIGMNTRANAAQGISATVGRTNTGVAKPPVQGNLSTPKAVPAAQVVGHALDGRNRIGGQGHAIRDIPTG